MDYTDLIERLLYGLAGLVICAICCLVIWWSVTEMVADLTEFLRDG